MEGRTIGEITAQALNPETFINEKVGEIRRAVGDGLAINALSGEVDSSTVTMLGHRALGDRLKTVFIQNAAFQYLAIVHEDRVTGMRDGKRDFGQQIEVRCWNSVDAREATPTRLPFEVLEQLAAEMVGSVPGVVSVTYNIASKPPSTIEAV
jgi:GMP synthase PP-ATPase subunit